MQRKLILTTLALKNYSTYTAEDFLEDERFRRWIISNGEQESSFWENFKEEFPEKVNDLILAKSLFMSLQELQALPDKNIKDKVWINVEDSINETSLENTHVNVRSPFYRWWMAAAASLLIAGGLAWSLRSTFKGVPVEYNKQVAVAEILLHEKINTTKKQQTILLKDGSTVKLKPGSKLSYSNFLSKQRVVYLDGEGYFDVAKDSSKPFIIYAGHIAVQVVGTSFNILSNTGKSKSNVSVTTGKVKVYPVAKIDKAGNYKEGQAIYLTPNQQVAFDANTGIFKRSLVAQPVQLAGIKDSKKFYFTNTSVNGILDTLGTAYGVVIRYDNKALESCKITAPLGDLPLFRKLDIICQTIGATYEVFGTEIVISGGDCNL